MALVRALNSAISGLRAQQFHIDTIGDNLANSTTTGFKAARVEFKTLLSQTISFGTAPQGFLGGIDPLQQGLGVTLSSTTRNFTQGELETTGVASDLAIDGAGFFVMVNEQGDRVYSRNGAFTINPSNLLHNPSSGFIVQGVNADLNTFTIASGAPIGNISIPIGNLQVAQATVNADFDGNLDGSGDQALMGTTLQSAALIDNTTAAAATAATLLSNLSRTIPTGSIDLAIDAGDTIQVGAVKGGRTLPTQRFFVGTSLPVDYDGFGTTLGDLNSWLQRALGINTSPSLQYGAIRDNDTNPNTTGVSFAATTVTTTSVTVTGVDFVAQGVQAGAATGDIIRFNTGAGAGQLGRITAIGGVGNSTLTISALSSSLPIPITGDQFTIHEPAGVTVSATAATPWLTNGAIHIAGNVGLSNALTNLQLTNVTDNIDVSPFTQIDAANGESIIANATFFDSNGASHLVEFTYVLETKGGVDLMTGSIGNTWRVFTESADSKHLVSGALAGTNRVTGDGTVRFSTSGQFLAQQPASASGFVSISIPNSGAQTPLNVLPDFSGMTGFASTISSAFMFSQDGLPTGVLSDFSIGENGVITGIFNNGITRPLGQIYLARFANVNGLKELDGSNFQQAANSGEAIVGQPGTVGIGQIISGALEASNVDFAREFTELIVSQRSFQANARVITTADDLLEELVNIV